MLRLLNGLFPQLLKRNCAFLAQTVNNFTPDTPVSYYPQGKTDLSHIDPVVIGRGAFNAANEFACGVAGCIQDALCAVLDNILEVVKGIYSHYVTAIVNCFPIGNITFFFFFFFNFVCLFFLRNN